MRKSLVVGGLLALAWVSQAAARNYEFLLPTATQAGHVTLAAGQYRLRVEGSTAVFTNVRSNEIFVVPVRLDNAPKHEAGVLDMKIALKKQAGMQVLASIELEDTSTTLKF
jgi:hypothetical protein